MMAGSRPAPPAPADPDAYQELSGRQDSRDGERRQHRGGGRADGDLRAGRRVLVLGQELLTARIVVDVPLVFTLVACWGADRRGLLVGSRAPPM
jgi:hypothetical protein